VISTIEYLIKNFDLAKKDKVVIVGMSAGGVGALVWGDWI
jgi:S-formylglutathione hydrolase FrmB